MSQYYNSQRTIGLYVPNSKEPFKLSRSKIDLFLNCPRCFYLDRKLGVGRPPSFPFNLNLAVDTLLKKEFDICRANNKNHPLIKKYGIDARPVAHKDLNTWRYVFTGIQHLYKPTNFLIFGGIDDLWQNSKGEFIVVDYKATSKNEPIIELNRDWHKTYKRQMEIYQWLFRQNKYKVSNTGYFVYCNADASKKNFDGKLEFNITLIPHIGDDTWIEQVIINAYKCLNNSEIPSSGNDCDYCSYATSVESKKDSPVMQSQLFG